MAKKTKPLFWITGNYYDCRKQWNWILSMLKNPNLEVLDCGSSADPRLARAPEIVRLLKSRDMFDSRPRIIKLKGLPDDYAILVDYLHLVSNDNILVIDGPIGYRAAKGSRLISAKTSKFYKVFAEQGVHTAPKGGTGVFEFPMEAANDSSAKSWVANVVKEMGRQIDDDAVALLVEQKGHNLDGLYAELQRLCDYQPKKITVEDVKDTVVPLFVSTAWDLIDLLDQQDYEKAIKHLQRFYSVAGQQMGDSFVGDVMMLLGALSQHFTFLFHLKHGLKGKLSYDHAENSVRGLKKKTEDGNFVELFGKGFLYANVRKPQLSQALNMSQEQLEDIFLDLCQTRFLCRTRYANNESAIKVCCDTFVMAACGIIAQQDSSAIKGFRRGLRPA